jgi:hypothetical protein
MIHEPRFSDVSKECLSGPYKYTFYSCFKLNTTQKLNTIKYKYRNPKHPNTAYNDRKLPNVIESTMYNIKLFSLCEPSHGRQ